MFNLCLCTPMYVRRGIPMHANVNLYVYKCVSMKNNSHEEPVEMELGDAIWSYLIFQTRVLAELRFSIWAGIRPPALKAYIAPIPNNAMGFTLGRFESGRRVFVSSDPHRSRLQMFQPTRNITQSIAIKIIPNSWMLKCSLRTGIFDEGNSWPKLQLWNIWNGIHRSFPVPTLTKSTQNAFWSLYIFMRSALHGCQEVSVLITAKLR